MSGILLTKMTKMSHTEESKAFNPFYGIFYVMYNILVFSFKVSKACMFQPSENLSVDKEDVLNMIINMSSQLLNSSK